MVSVRPVRRLYLLSSHVVNPRNCTNEFPRKYISVDPHTVKHAALCRRDDMIFWFMYLKYSFLLWVVFLRLPFFCAARPRLWTCMRRTPRQPFRKEPWSGGFYSTVTVLFLLVNFVSELTRWCIPVRTHITANHRQPTHRWNPLLKRKRLYAFKSPTIVGLSSKWKGQSYLEVNFLAKTYNRVRIVLRVLRYVVFYACIK